MAIKGWSQRPIFGWGQENFNYIFNANYNPVMWNQEQWFDRAHSVFLDWLTASGLVGLFSYLSLYVLFLLCVWKSSLSLAEKSVLTGLLAGYAVHNVFVFDNLASYVLFFSAMGFVSSLKEGKPLRWLGSATMSAESIEYIAGPIVIIALVGVVWFFDVRPIQANTDLIAALTVCGGQGSDAALFQNALNVNVYVANQEIREQLLSCGGRIITNQQMPGPTRQAFLALASQAIDDQIAATPTKDARIYTLGGSFMDEIGQFAPSVTLLGTAHELSPGKQSISIELANGLINTGKYDDAVKLLAPTYQSATDDTQAATAYALALVIDGQEAKAHEIFGNDPAVFETSNMAQAYMAIKEYPKALEIYRSALAVATTSVDAAVKLAQAQYQAGMIAASAATLRGLEKAHPEYASQIEASIKQMQAGK
jgi:tetratricopeptide (TPR) repeat protein